MYVEVSACARAGFRQLAVELVRHGRPSSVVIQRSGERSKHSQRVTVAKFHKHDMPIATHGLFNLVADAFQHFLRHFAAFQVIFVDFLSI